MKSWNHHFIELEDTKERVILEEEEERKKEERLENEGEKDKITKEELVNQVKELKKGEARRKWYRK